MLQNPDANDMLKLAASSCIYSKDYDTALAYYTELQNNGYNQPDIYKSLASVYNAMGNNDKAFEMISKGLEATPNDPGLLIEKVNLYINEGKSQEALNDLLSLNELDQVTFQSCMPSVPFTVTKPIRIFTTSTRLLNSTAKLSKSSLTSWMPSTTSVSLT